MVAAAAIGEPDSWTPFPKQEAFLRLGCYEALFGGSAGPGKSETLVAGALRHIGNPSYRALLLRRTVPELERSEGLIDRAQKLFRIYDGVPTHGGKRWRFPSGARIELLSMQHEEDRHSFKSSEYQYIGFDELTSFTEMQYRYMFSRLRSAAGIPVRMRAATNPGGVGHDWVLARWAPWLYPEWVADYDGQRAAFGEVLYFRQRLGKIDEEEVVPRGTERALGRSFVQAKVADNPVYAGTVYETGLEQLDPLTRAQLKEGDWMARPGARVFFKRETIPIVDLDDVPTNAALVRYWDRAATENPKADWTVGMLLAYLKPTWWIVDVVRGQWEPADVERVIKRVAAYDDPSAEPAREFMKVTPLQQVRPLFPPPPPALQAFVRDAVHRVRLVLERDPAQAGKFEARYYIRELAGYDVHAVAPQGDKLTRAKPASAQADHGFIRMVRGRWNRAVLDVLEGFPEGSDDDVDALSGGFRETLRSASSGTRSGGRRHESSSPARAGGY